MGDNEEKTIPDLDELDKVLLMDAEEIMDSMAFESVMDTETIIDEDLCDVEDLIGEEGLKIIDKYKEDRRIKKEEKEARERERKEVEEKVEKFIQSHKQEMKEYKRSLRSSTYIEFDGRIPEHQRIFNEVTGENDIDRYIDKCINIRYTGKYNHEDFDRFVDKINLMKKTWKKELEDLKKTEIERCNKLKEEADKAKAEFHKNNGMEKATASFSEIEDITGLESVFETNLDAALTVGAVGTVGYWLYKNLIATKKPRNELGHNRFQNAYYYVLNNDFKKSERSLNTLLHGRKRFIVSKSVLEEVIGFRKKYYNVMAMTANRFMEAYEDLKDLIGKEKMYSFSEPNPVRDKSLINKLNNAARSLYELKNSNFIQAASPILSYEANYETSGDTSKIMVDSNYLETILNPKETFRIVRELESISEKIPPYDSAERYDELLVKESTPGPLNVYVSIMYELRDLAEKVLGIVNAYVYTVYSLLDYCIIANDKKNGPVEESLQATEGVIRDLKVKKIINENRIITERMQNNSTNVKEKVEFSDILDQASNEIKKIKGGLLIKGKIATLETLCKDYQKFAKKGYEYHPTALKETAKAMFLAGRHETIGQLIHNAKDTSLQENNLLADLEGLARKTFDWGTKDISNDAREAVTAEAKYLQSLITNCYAEIACLNQNEAKLLLHYFTLRNEVLMYYVRFSTIEEEGL